MSDTEREHGPHEVHWRWTQLIWMAYLPLVVVEAAQDRIGAREWVMLIAALALFIVLYVRALQSYGGHLLPYVGFSLGLGLLLAPDNLGAVIFYAYAAGAAAYLENTALALALIAVVVAAAALEAWALHQQLIFWVGGVVASFVGAVNYLSARLRRVNLSLHRANAEIERLAAVAERDRIARDLHDVLGHTLSLITLKAELGARLAERDAPRAAAEFRDVERASRAALAEIRQVVRGYRGRVGDEAGRARALLEAAGLDADIAISANDLAPVEEEALAFALREGVTNVVRYAEARRCRVRLERIDATCVLEIEDDGRGIRGETPEGNGLRGMRERVAALGGSLERTTGDGGTRLHVTIPCTGRARDAHVERALADEST